jgi:hypothetical protein
MKRIIPLTVAVGILLPTLNVPAEQSGTGHYISGATASFIDMTSDQPGVAAMNIFLDYNDANADASHGLPLGRAIALNLNANVYADSLFVMYTFETPILGGHYAIAAAPGFVRADVKASGTIDNNGVPHTASISQTASGLGDIEFWPMLLGWKEGDFKYDVRLAIYAPSGDYSASTLGNPVIANVGLGYWTFEPEVNFSWLSSKWGTEVSIFNGLDFNTDNTQANYQSGDIYHVDATVAEHLPLLGGFVGVGANAFYYKQFTADSGSGARLGSFEAMSEGIGPEASYIHLFGTKQLAMEAKWLPQTQVENTLKGNLIWVKIAFVF